TTFEMVLGGVGAATGAAIGFFLIHGTIIGDRFAEWIAPILSLLRPTVEITASPEIIIFALAGCLTGWGLTLAGGFGQERRPIVAGVTGVLGYSVAWLIWQSSSFALPALGFVSAIAVVPLVLGLGLPSHYLVHAVVAAVGMGTVFGGLASLNVWSNDIFGNVFSKSAGNLDAFINTIGFFCFWGVILGFWLGVSYYLLVPVLRWLGWR
ncbi:MAG: serine/threonine protein kinase, partial [Cyanobacteriota bacterium]